MADKNNNKISQEAEAGTLEGIQVAYQPTDEYVLTAYQDAQGEQGTSTAAAGADKQEPAAGPLDYSLKGANGDENDKKEDKPEDEDKKEEDNDEDNGNPSASSSGGFSILRHLLENGKRQQSGHVMAMPCLEYFQRTINEDDLGSPTGMMMLPDYFYQNANSMINYALNYGNCVRAMCPILGGGGDWQTGPYIRLEYLVQGPPQQMQIQQDVMGGGGGENEVVISDDDETITDDSGASSTDSDFFESDGDLEERPLVIDEGEGEGEEEMEAENYTSQVEPLNLSCH